MEDAPSSSTKEWHAAEPTHPPTDRKPLDKTGKWLVFAQFNSDMDEAWAKIKQATESGTLGHRSTVKTGSKNCEHKP